MPEMKKAMSASAPEPEACNTAINLRAALEEAAGATPNRRPHPRDASGEDQAGGVRARPKAPAFSRFLTIFSSGEKAPMPTASALEPIFSFSRLTPDRGPAY
jgi:hypothetical protein